MAMDITIYLKKKKNIINGIYNHKKEKLNFG